MAKWILKAVVQKAISFLPAKERINFFFQKYVTRGVELTDEHLGYKLDAARDHIRYYDKYGTVDRKEARTLELGTGWYPIVPLMLYLSGFSQTVSIDIRKWSNKERQLIAIARVLEYYDRGLLGTYFKAVQPDRIEVLREVLAHPDTYDEDRINERIGLEIRIMDATQLDFPDGSFDLICSNNTFEHIYPHVLRRILKEFKRVLKPAGVMSHFIDLSDHFAHLDGAIGIYNFLRFTHKQWALIDNDIQPQNRLRWPDYVAMYQDLKIPIREEAFRAGDPALVKQVPLAADYRGYSPEQLAISHGYIIT